MCKTVRGRSRGGGVELPYVRMETEGGGQAGVSLWCVEGRSTLPFIWAGPLTSTEKGFFLGMSGCKLLGRLVVQMKKKNNPGMLPLLAASPPQASGPSLSPFALP